MKEVLMFAMRWLSMMLLVALLCLAARVIGKFLGNGKSKDKMKNNDIKEEAPTPEDNEPTESTHEVIAQENDANTSESESEIK